MGTVRSAAPIGGEPGTGDKEFLDSTGTGRTPLLYFGIVTCHLSLVPRQLVTCPLSLVLCPLSHDKLQMTNYK